jgi:hypothetical protein
MLGSMPMCGVGSRKNLQFFLVTVSDHFRCKATNLLVDPLHLFQAVGAQKDFRKQVIVLRQQSFCNAEVLFEGGSGCLLLLHAGRKTMVEEKGMERE